jgi:quercetin dioxygenase-like cupin family protein
MKYIVDLNEIESIAGFSPPHHTATKDRKLVDETIGAKNLAIWHGEIGTGGKADPHFHEEMEQAFLILDGEGIFRLGEEEHRVGVWERAAWFLFLRKSPTRFPPSVRPL